MCGTQVMVANSLAIANPESINFDLIWVVFIYFYHGNSVHCLCTWIYRGSIIKAYFWLHIYWGWGRWSQRSRGFHFFPKHVHMVLNKAQALLWCSTLPVPPVMLVLWFWCRSSGSYQECNKSKANPNCGLGHMERSQRLSLSVIQWYNKSTG